MPDLVERSVGKSDGIEYTILSSALGLVQVEKQNGRPHS